MRNETGLGLCILSSENGFDGNNALVFGLPEPDRGAVLSLLFSMAERVATAFWCEAGDYLDRKREGMLKLQNTSAGVGRIRGWRQA